MLAGATVLHCCAEIEEPVQHTHNAEWLSMNATVFFKNDIGSMCKIRCLLNYFPKQHSHHVTAGNYAILAMVHLFDTAVFPS